MVISNGRAASLLTSALVQHPTFLIMLTETVSDIEDMKTTQRCRGQTPFPTNRAASTLVELERTFLIM